MGAQKEVSFIIRVKDAGSAALKQIESAATHTTEKLFSFKDILKDLVGVAAAFSLAEVVKDMYDLGIAADKTFRIIAANLPTFTEGIGRLKEEIEGIAEASGRGIEEMEQSALAIAKLGVSGAEELKQQLAAATMLADATGTSVDESAQLLIQLRREFHLTGDEALATAAKLASAARGKVAITELFSAFQASSPVFEKFNIDVDTGTKAIIALVQNGYGIRQVRGILNGLDASGIRELAEHGHIAADAMKELADRAGLVRDAVDATNKRLKNEFVQTLEDVGSTVVTKLNGPLVGLIGLLKIVKDGNWFAWSAAARGDLVGFMAALTNPDQGSHAPETHGSSGTWGDSTSNKKFAPPMSEADKKKIEEAAKKLRELRLEVANLSRETEAAKPKSEQFRESIEKFAEKAREAKMPADELDDRLAQMRATLAGMQNDEAAKAVEEDLSALGEAFSKLSGGALQQLGHEAEQTFTKLDEARKKLSTPADLQKHDDAVNALRASYQRLRTAVSEAADSEQLIIQIQDDLSNGAVTTDQISNAIGRLVQRAQEAKEGLRTATDPKEAEQYRKEIQQINSEVGQLFTLWDEVGGVVVDDRKKILEIAQAWSTVGRSVIAAAQAVGEMDSTTAASLQNLVSLGDGIMRLFGGDIAGGIAESISSLGALVHGLFGGTDAASKAHQKLVEDNTTALRQLTAKVGLLGGLNVSGSDLDAALKAVAVITGRFSAGQIRDAQGHALDTKADTSGITPEQMDLIREAAKALGIEIDGTGQSFYDLMIAISKARGTIGKFGDDFTSVMNAISAQEKVFGNNGPLSNLQDLMAKIGPMSKGIADFFTGFDLSHLSPADVDAIRKRVQDAFLKLIGGGISPDELGKLTGDQFEQVIMSIIDDLNGLGTSATDETARINENLKIRELYAQGLTDEADALKRDQAHRDEIAQAVRDGWTEDEIAALKLTQALEDQKLAQDKLAAAAEKSTEMMANLTARFLKVGGNTVAASEAELAEQQRRELDQAKKDGATATELGMLTIVQTFERAQAGVQRAIDGQTKVVEDQLSVDQQQLQTAQASLQATQHVLDTLSAYGKSLVIDPNLSPLSPKEQLDAARSQLQDLYGKALGGDKAAAEQFPQLANTFLQLSHGFNASGPGYVSDFQSVQAMVGSLSEHFSGQLSHEQQMIDALNAQVALLTQQLNALKDANAIAQQTKDAVIAELRKAQDETLKPNDALIAELTALRDTLSGVGRDIVDAQLAHLRADQQAVQTATQAEIDAIQRGDSLQHIATLDQIRILTEQKTAADDHYIKQIEELGKDLGFDSPIVKKLIDEMANYDSGVDKQIAAISGVGDTIAGAIGRIAATPVAQKPTTPSNPVPGIPTPLPRRPAPAIPAFDAASAEEDFKAGLPPDTPDAQGLWEYFASTHGIHGFAAGGDFSGGVGMFGERGPELAFSGPARILTASQTRELLSGGQANGELVKQARETNRLIGQHIRATVATQDELRKEMTGTRRELADVRREMTNTRFAREVGS